MIPKQIIALVTGAVMLVLLGCGGGETVLTVDEGATTTLGVRAVNASTEEPIPDVTFTITSGGDAFDETTVTDSAGIATFNLKDTEDPANTPIDTSVQARAEGYITSGKAITIESTGAVDLVIPLVNIENGMTGVEVATDTTNAPTNDDGSVNEIIEASVTATEGDSVNESSGITVPSGIGMTDAEGNPVSGSRIETTVAYFDASSPEAVEAFPGGLSVAIAADSIDAANANADGTTGTIEDDGEVTFISGGFTSIEMSAVTDNADGSTTRQDITQFDTTGLADGQKPKVEITISGDTVNPDGDESADADSNGEVTVAESYAANPNMTFPMWSYDVDKGEWRYEGEGTVAQDAGNNDLYIVSREVDHLSYWNLDWFRGGDRRCRRKTINIMNDASGGIYTDRARVTITAASGSGYSRTSIYEGDGTLVLYGGVPRNVPVTITFTDLTTGETLTSSPTTVSNLCDTNFDTISITPPAPANETYVNLTVRTETICSNDDQEPAVPVGRSRVYLYEISPSPFSFVDFGRTDQTTGEITFNILAELGTTVYEYRIYAYNRIDGIWEQRDLSFSADSTEVFQFSQFCETTGAG